MGLALALPLLASLCAQAEETRLEPSKWPMEPIFTVPILPQANRIDAVLADNEWEGATAISAVFDASIGAQSVQPITFRLGYHGDALYLGFKMQRPKGCKFPRITDQTQGYTSRKLFQRDDNLEVWLAPIAKGVEATGMMKPQYAIAANAAGAYYHVMTGRARDKIPRNLAYSPYFDYNTGTWQGELKFPWSLFEAMDVAGKKPPADGVEWKGVMFFHQVTPAKNWLGIQPKLKFHPTLRFSAKPIGFSISALELSEPGKAAFTIAINNRSVGAVAYELDYEVFRRNSVPRSRDERFLAAWEYIERIKEVGPKKAAIKQGEIQYIKTVQQVENELNQEYRWVDAGVRSIPTKPNERAVCRIDFAAPDGYYVLRYDLREKATGRTVMRQVIPAFLFLMSLDVKPEFLLKRITVARVNVSGLRDLAKGDPIHFSLSNAQGTRLEAEQVAWDGANHVVMCMLPTAKTQEEQTYTVAVEARHDGRTVGKVSESVHRPATPEWFGHDLGKTAKTPWGYEPIKCHDDGFGLVLRKYVMADRPFPQQIVARGEPLLAGPVELTGIAQGKPLARRYGKLQLRTQTDTEAHFEQELQANGLTMKIRGQLEFDGLIKYDVELTPTSGTATVDKLVLSIPVLAKYVRWYAHQALSTDFAGCPCPAYPYGALSDFFKDHPKGWLPFTWAMYLGCRDRGIEWVAESDRYWSPENEQQMIRVTKGDDRVTMAFHFVTEPIELKSPRTISFGIQTTPIRRYTRERYYRFRKTPLSYRPDPDWKQFERSLGEFNRLGFNYYNIYINASALNLFSNARYYDEKTLSNFTRYARSVHRGGHKLVYYCGYGLPHGLPNDDTFGNEMRMEPVKPSGWYNHASPFADYWLHSVKFMCDHCDLDGVQTDGLPVVPFMSNPTYDLEWARRGRRHGTYPVFAVRELMKRLYIMLKFELARGKEGFHTVHCDRPPVYCIDGWGDLALSGEAHHHTVTSLRELFPDRYGVFYDTLDQGVAPYALWSYGRDVAVTRNMAYTLHHLHGVRVGYAARLGAYGPSYEITGGFTAEAEMWHRFNLADTEFRPYWRHPGLATVESDDLEVELPKAEICVSAFVRPGKEALLIVANLARVGYTLKIAPNLSALSLPGDLSQYHVRDPIHRCGIYTRPKLRIDIHPQRWRAILLRKRQ